MRLWSSLNHWTSHNIPQPMTFVQSLVKPRCIEQETAAPSTNCQDVDTSANQTGLAENDGSQVTVESLYSHFQIFERMYTENGNFMGITCTYELETSSTHYTYYTLNYMYLIDSIMYVYIYIVLTLYINYWIYVIILYPLVNPLSLNMITKHVTFLRVKCLRHVYCEVRSPSQGLSPAPITLDQWELL